MGERQTDRTGERPPSVIIRYVVRVTRRSSYVGLLSTLAIFLLLTTLHSLIVPITQGEDELAHYRYISFIAQTGRLPINYVEREQAWYRSDWPPLYHLLVGWAVSPLDTTRPRLKDVGESPHRRLVGEIFYPRLIIYTEDANWPWQDGILAWHIGRFISILFSAGALVFTYLTVLELGRGAGEQRHSGDMALAPLPLLATAVTALLAFTPRFLFTSAMLSDDSLFILLSAIFIWLLLRALRGDDRWSVYAVLGLLVGLSIATKYSTGLLPLAVIPVVLWRARQVGWSWLQWLGRVAVNWLATLAGAGWWFGWIGYYFNTVKEDGLFFGLLKPLLASGPDVSMRRIFSFFTGGQFTGQERPDAIEAGTFWDWLTYLFQTFWGVPVLEYDPLFPWAYLLLLLFCLLALVGLWQLWSTADGQTRLTLALLVLIVALLFPFPILRFFMTHNVFETGQGRHILYPAAQAIPMLLVLGWQRMANRRIGEWRMANGERRTTNGERRTTNDEWRHAARDTQATRRQGYARNTQHAARNTQHATRNTLHLSLPPLLLLCWSLFQLIYMALTYPPPLPVQTSTFDPAAIPQALEHHFGDDIHLLGYDFAPDPEQALARLTLYWRSMKPVQENYRIQVQLIDPSGQPRFTWLSHPLNGRYPTRAWDKGDVIRDELPLPLAAMSPNFYTIQVNLLHEAEDTPLVGEPLTLVQFDLPVKPAIANTSTLAEPTGQMVDYRLWSDNTPAHYRQTLALSWAYRGHEANEAGSSQHLTWTLLGPDQAPRLPVATGDATAIFMVGADWPSGDYRLQVQNDLDRGQTEPVLTVANDFRRFDLPPDLTGQAGWTPVEASFAGPQGLPQVKLLGYILPTRRVEPGAGLPLTLYWQSLAPVLGDYVVFDVLLDENQQVYGGYDRLPREYYSTILWAEGEVVEDGFIVPVSPEAPPGVYHVRIGLYTLATGSPISLPLIQAGQPIDETSVVIGPIKVGGPPPDDTTSSPAPQITLNQPFGNQVTLLGYDLADQDNQPIQNSKLKIQNLKLTLYWRTESRLETDYTTFFHLRDAANTTVAQRDRPPAEGRYPTTLWDAGEIVVDEIILPLDQVPPGQYTPVVGLYDPITGTRLPPVGAPDPAGQANELHLERVTLP